MACWFMSIIVFDYSDPHREKSFFSLLTVLTLTPHIAVHNHDMCDVLWYVEVVDDLSFCGDDGNSNWHVRDNLRPVLEHEDKIAWGSSWFLDPDNYLYHACARDRLLECLYACFFVPLECPFL